MRVKHLFVVWFKTLGQLDVSEEKNSALQLYRKFRMKSCSAVLVEGNEFPGAKFPSKLERYTGDSPCTLKTEGAEEDPATGNDQAQYNHEIGFYLVFHGDDDSEGEVIDPELVATCLADFVPVDRRKDIRKIAMMVCNIGKETVGSQPMESFDGESMKKTYEKRGFGKKFPLMFSLLNELAERGIRPMICGYDVPVFIGSAFENKIRVKVHGGGKKVWETKDDHDGYAGRKFTLGKKKDVRELIAEQGPKNENPYKALHKKVVRLTQDGTISMGLAGWSDKA